VDDEPVGRVEIELLDQILPVTTSNFKALCSGENKHGFSFKGTPIHHIVKGASIVGGDVEVNSGCLYVCFFNPTNILFFSLALSLSLSL
jgi:peptidylprolyl isomerase